MRPPKPLILSILLLLMCLTPNVQCLPRGQPSPHLVKFVTAMKYASALYEDNLTWLTKMSNKLVASMSPPSFSKYFSPRSSESNENSNSDSALSRYYTHISSKKPEYSSFYKNSLKEKHAIETPTKPIFNAKIRRRNL